MSVYKKFIVTVTGELADGEKTQIHEFVFSNPKKVNMSQTVGYTETEYGDKIHYERNGHGTFELKVET